MAQKKYDQACPKFADSQKEDPSPGTLLNLARCHEEAGKTASAWAEYKEAGVLARNMGQSDREQAARDFSAKLEPSLSKLQIDAPSDIPGLEIRRDTVVVGGASLGLAIAVDPGEHLIEASAPGYSPWSTKITIGKEKDLQKVAVPALVKAPETAAVVPPGTPPPATEPTVAPPPSSGTGRTVGFVLGGLGVVGVGIGAITGIMASSKVSNAKSDLSLCPNQSCSPAGRSAIDSASTLATVSTIGFIGGGVALGAGVILILTQGPAKKKKDSAMMHVLPEAGPQGGGLRWVGSF